MLLIAQEVIQIQTPKSSSELNRAVARRDELRSQLESASEQRSNIAAQLDRTGSDPVLRNPLLDRLKAADARIAQLEKDVQSSDNAIAKAKSEGVGGDQGTSIYFPAPPAMPDIPPQIWTMGGTPWRERVLNSLEITAPITIATVVLLGALLYWRISRSMRNQFTRMLAMQQSRLDEIQRSVDTVAVEMERVSENQRFVTKLVGEKASAGVRQ